MLKSSSKLFFTVLGLLLAFCLILALTLFAVVSVHSEFVAFADDDVIPPSSAPLVSRFNGPCMNFESTSFVGYTTPSASDFSFVYDTSSSNHFRRLTPLSNNVLTYTFNPSLASSAVSARTDYYIIFKFRSSGISEISLSTALKDSFFNPATIFTTTTFTPDISDLVTHNFSNPEYGYSDSDCSYFLVNLTSSPFTSFSLSITFNSTSSYIDLFYVNSFYPGFSTVQEHSYYYLDVPYYNAVYDSTNGVIESNSYYQMAVTDQRFGYSDGYDTGLSDGYDDGYDAGLSDGYDTGLADGYVDGYDTGLSDGYDDGYDAGFADLTRLVGTTYTTSLSDFTYGSNTYSYSNFRSSYVPCVPGTVTDVGESSGMRDFLNIGYLDMFPDFTFDQLRNARLLRFYWSSTLNSCTFTSVGVSTFNSSSPSTLFVSNLTSFSPGAITLSSSYTTSSGEQYFLIFSVLEHSTSLRTFVAYPNGYINPVTYPIDFVCISPDPCDDSSFSITFELSFLTDTSSYDAGFDSGLLYASTHVDSSSASYQYAYNNVLEGSASYIAGRNSGLDASQNISFKSLISAVISVPVNTFISLTNFDFLGINLKNFILSLLTLGLIVAIVKIII